MRIDEAGGDDQAPAVDSFGGAVGHAADLGNLAICDRQVGGKARGAGAVDDRAVFNNDVVGHDLASLARDWRKLTSLAISRSVATGQE